ncbi:hypothetical protein CCAX7_47320 [Capsulimonas corticalis]|uniref:Uncharacterized protein n=1 Tax=Capsulimonas corticalis TaxID=2219043 RepID=A0A402CQI4_9BACT|nr:sugar-binding domain-containing protein [Capsulimonas corticalis]BDI32681.1 hypothetical protein CCAX7_47320 [Capsulimonas corticalis]
MSHSRAVAALAGLFLTALPSFAEPVTPVLTRWAKEVTPQNVHPEYPRPQMTRGRWQNLNGQWDYALVDKDAPSPASYDGKILVPFPIEAPLSGVRKHPTDQQRLWYRRSFSVPAAWKGEHVLLHFGAVDWDAEVFVNGKRLGEHKGGYDGFSFDVTDALKPGENELKVGVYDPTNSGEQPVGKQDNDPHFIVYTATSGIWQTVWLEPVAKSYISDLAMTPDIDKSVLRLTVKAAGGNPPSSVKITVLDGAKTVAVMSGAANASLAIPIPKAHLWSPSDPHLYQLKVALQSGSVRSDAVESYFAMRKISLGKDAKGITRMFVNNQYLFEVGVLDQGFWPDGEYTAPTDGAMENDIATAKRLGFNMIRKHVKVEPERWYYWADRLGMLVWQDMPTAGHRTPESKTQFETELDRMVEGRGNHPSVIMWVLFNEGSDYDVPRLVDHVRALDPSRLIDNASGWNDHGVGDVIDTHNYTRPKAPAPEEHRAAVAGEFGGLGMLIPGHLWGDPKNNWGYGNMADSAAFGKGYAHLMHIAYGYQDDPGLSAAVYTQLTDVEIENSGLMTYDREIVKPDLHIAQLANRGEFPTEPKVTDIVATSETHPAEWRYTTTDHPAPANWFAPDFDDAGWKSAPAPFGNGGAQNTKWSDTPGDIWMRRTVTLPADLPATLMFSAYYDEDMEIYINGVLAASAPGFTSDYVAVPMTDAGRKAIVPGKNVLAVHCGQKGGGQFIDVGIIAPQSSPSVHK